MALGDYILCCKCEVKLIYDGDRGQREWWEERFGKPPEIECPDCKTQRPWVGLTLEDKKEYLAQDFGGSRADAMDWAEKRLKEKNT